jgi:Tannase and feruloyl esterase
VTCERLLALVSLTVLGAALETFAGEASTRCDALTRMEWANIPDALTRLTESKFVTLDTDTRAYCQVSGYVAPSVGFVLRLPAEHWNGKFIELGCGGFCGSTDHIAQCDALLSKGYACIVSDGGHKGGDAKWAYNNVQAKIDLAYNASHVTALAGKAIVARYYTRTPRKSYFMGCSRGGIQALEEAQKFPWDFDGIIAGAPAPRITEQWVDRLWKKRAITEKGGEPVLGSREIEILHQAVVAKCDRNDGLNDGLIGDPRACQFDPAQLLCTAANANECLTAKQVDAVQKIYHGAVTSTGMQIGASSALLGSELNWLNWFWGPGNSDAFLGDGIRYTLFTPDAGPTWQLNDFDFDRDFKRIGVSASLWQPSPDLRQFKAAGGKLLSYMGWSDVAGGGPLPTVDYYETAERIVGGRQAAQDFYRLFMIPGMDHCTGGAGAFAIDYLRYLEAWVEMGQAPTKLIAAHVSLPSDLTKANQKLSTLRFPLDPADVEFYRPVYPYPVIAKYSGHGDPRDAANFEPVNP